MNAGVRARRYGETLGLVPTSFGARPDLRIAGSGYRNAVMVRYLLKNNWRRLMNLIAMEWTSSAKFFIYMMMYLTVIIWWQIKHD